jgi:hypothetical protein
MPLAGNLRQFALSDILRVIESGQRVGVLVVTHDHLQANIYFSGGQWLGAERVGMAPVLAQQLVRAGLITAEQFEGVFGVAFVHAGSISDAQAIRGLIAARLLTQDQLRAFAMHDATALLAVMLSWTEGDFIFEDGVALPQGRVALPLAIGPLVAQAIRLTRPAGPVREVPSLSLDTIIDFAEVDPKSGTAIEVSRDQWRLLTAVDGQTPLWAIAEILQAPEALTLRLANELVAAGFLIVAGRMAAAAH